MNDNTKKYIGPRVMPVFAEPVEYDPSKTYEPLTIVAKNRKYYISRCYVKPGIDVLNKNYWLPFGSEI